MECQIQWHSTKQLIEAVSYVAATGYALRAASVLRRSPRSPLVATYFTVAPCWDSRERSVNVLICKVIVMTYRVGKRMYKYQFF